MAELFATRQALGELTRQWTMRRKFRKNSASLRALGQLPHYPVITISRLASLLGVAFPRASEAVDQLVEVGTLKERTGYRRNRVFVAEEVLIILNRPFGSEPVLPEAS